MSAKASWHQNYVTVTLCIVLLFPKMPASSKTHALLLLSFTNAIYWMSLKIGSLDKTNKNWNILWEIEKLISDWLSTVFFNFEIIALTENYYTRLTALCPGLTRWAGTRREIKTNLDFTEARDSEWQWHQLGHMQVCTSLQTDNHASTPPLSFFTGRMPFLPPNQQRQSTDRNCLNYK